MNKYDTKIIHVSYVYIQTTIKGKGMKKIITIVVFNSLLVACSGGSSSASLSSEITTDANVPIKKQEKLAACSVLNESFIKSHFSGATDIKLKESDSSYPLCNARFISQGSAYELNLTLGVIGKASAKTLDASVSYFSKNLVEPLEGVGEKAYLKTGMMGQISALSGGNLIHFGLYKNDTLDLELPMAKDIMNKIFKKLEG